MSWKLMPEGEIGLNEKWKWVVDQRELKDRDALEIKIGGHWIPGVLIECRGDLFWSSWLDAVTVPINYAMRARWPTEQV